VEGVLLSVHVLAGIVFVGGSAIAASLFPRYAPVSAPATAPVTAPVPAATGPAADPEPASEGGRSRAVAVALHRITRGYGLFGVVVPVVGIALAVAQGRMGEIWITISMVLTAAAGAILALFICPRQREALDTPDDGTRLRTLSMLAGVYNVLWAVVVVMMIVRPGDHS
jgi:zinc transporter ZupT